VAVAPVAALGPFAPPAAAQPAGAGDPYKVVVITTAPSPYWGYTYTPYAVFVPGPGDLIRARGNFLIKKEEATPSRLPSPASSISYDRGPVDGSTGRAFF
jgi:hypothetical protein